jgi:type I restriction enzyme, R subunit
LLHDSRIKLVAKDLVEHFETRLSAMDGKAMIVVMSRRIAVALYTEIIALRPNWHGEDDGKGALKIVMTGSASDPPGVAGAHSKQEAPRGTRGQIP